MIILRRLSFVWEREDFAVPTTKPLSIYSICLDSVVDITVCVDDGSAWAEHDRDSG